MKTLKDIAIPSRKTDNAEQMCFVGPLRPEPR